jgi:hypothetical protein
LLLTFWLFATASIQILARNVIHYVPVLLPSHHVQVHKIVKISANLAVFGAFINLRTEEWRKLKQFVSDVLVMCILNLNLPWKKSLSAAFFYDYYVMSIVYISPVFFSSIKYIKYFTMYQ